MPIESIVDPTGMGPTRLSGAEGYGTDTIGGRGGRVIYVTNLNDSGSGSFRAALTAEGQRIVMFKVGGTITLKSKIRMKGANSFVTVAGQSAPGDGIQVRGYGIQMYFGIHDVVLRYMRVRIDPALFETDANEGVGIIAWGNTNQKVYNIVIDHCSIQWAKDEALHAYHFIDNITFSYNLVAESSRGLMIAAKSTGKAHMSVHHNVLAHNEIRNPLIGHSDHKTQQTPPAFTVDLRNNIVYNWNGRGTGQYERGVAVNMVNNLYLDGPNNNPNYIGKINYATQVYLKGNLAPNCPTGCDHEWDVGFFDNTDQIDLPQASEAQYRAFTEHAISMPVTTSAASTLMNDLLPTVGASLPKRDALDIRIINELKNGTGRIRKGSGFPTLSGGSAPLDTDGDGMPDNWENTHNLDPNDASDGSKVQGGPGYTNVEVYLNTFLLGDVTPPTADTTAPAPPSYVTIN